MDLHNSMRTNFHDTQDHTVWVILRRDLEQSRKGLLIFINGGANLLCNLPGVLNNAVSSFQETSKRLNMLVNQQNSNVFAFRKLLKGGLDRRCLRL
jgi:hypothetical protein